MEREASKILYKALAIIIVGVSILTAEYFYFCNRLYTIEVAEEDCKLTVSGKPDQQMKLAVGISILVAIYIMGILGWLTYRNRQKLVCESERDIQKPYSKK